MLKSHVPERTRIPHALPWPLTLLDTCEPFRPIVLAGHRVMFTDRPRIGEIHKDEWDTPSKGEESGSLEHGRHSESVRRNSITGSTPA